MRIDPKSQFDPGVLPHTITNKIPFCRLHMVGNYIGQVNFDVSSPGPTKSCPYDLRACPDDNANQ